MHETMLKRRIEQLDRLPVHPYVLARLLQTLRDAPADVERVTGLVCCDPGLLAMLLRTHQQHAPAPAGHVPQPRAIIDRLGTDAVGGIALLHALDDGVSDAPASLDPRVDAYWRTSLYTAACARLVSAHLPETGSPVAAHEAETAGLLYDVGTLAFRVLAAALGEAPGLATDEERLAASLETSPTSLNRTLAGKWLAERWQFPDRLTAAIWLHRHAPDRLTGWENARGLITAVQAAVTLAASAPGGQTPLRIGSLTLEPPVADQVRREAESIVQSRLRAFRLDEDALPALPGLVKQSTRLVVARHAETASAHRACQREAARMRALHELNVALRPGAALGEVVHTVSLAVRDGLGLAPGICCVPDPGSGCLHLVSWQSRSDAPETRSVPVGRQALEAGGDAAMAQALQALGLGLGDGGWEETGLRDVIHWEGLVAAPMLIDSRCFGQILFDAATSAFELDEDAFRELLAFAAGCGVAVARCREQEAVELRSEGLVAAMERADDLERRLDGVERSARFGEFAAAAVDGLNTPLNLASSQMRWLAQRAQEPNSHRALQTLLRHTRTVHDTLSHLSALAHPVTPAREPSRVAPAVHEALATLADEAEQAGVRLVERYDEAAPRVAMDGRLFSQAVRALARHGLSAMQRTGGALTVQTWADPQNNSVSIRLTDNGPGVAPHRVNELFEPAAGAAVHGSGLALAAAREIIQAHDGRLLVQSDPDLGTTFTIELPAGELVTPVPAEGEAPAAPPAPDTLVGESETPEGPVALLADADPTVRTVLERALSDRGFGVVIAEEGSKALRALRGRRFDLAVVDLTLRDNGGGPLLETLRARDGAVPLIAMSSSARQEDLDLAAHYGARACLQKPFQLRDFLGVVDDTYAAEPAARG